MIVRIKRNKCEFGKLACGDVFQTPFEEETYIKTECIEERYEENYYNAVRLEDGKMCTFGEKYMIVPINGEFVISQD